MADGETKPKRTSGYEVLSYRLDSIEKTLSEIKGVVTETKLQEKDIKSLADSVERILEKLDNHETRISALETEPVKNKAEKWQYITDYLFKTIVAGGIIYFLAKIGFPIGG